MKYLPKFKWDHLTEEINYQKAIREQRLAAEVAAAKRERDFYLSRVDKAKAVASIEERKKKRKKEDGGEAENAIGTTTDGNGDAKNKNVMRTYGQRKPKADPVLDDTAPTLSRSVLEMIAGGKKKKKTNIALP